jgi:hypothetical protein
MSAIYSFIFIFTSNHIEFLGLLSNNETLNSSFWNGWSYFIKAGNMKFIGYLIISLTIVILIVIIFKRVIKYDEYQVSILSKSLIVAGLLSILLLPIIMILLLSDPNYSVETILLFTTIQWISVLVSYLIYVIKF